MLEKTKNNIKNNLLYYLTFLTGTLIIIILFTLQELAPFGENSMLTIDFFHQYAPMLTELFDRVKSGANLIYSFSMGMGLPFIRNFLNYLSSPFNAIIFFFKHENLLMAFSIIIGLKSVFASTSLSYYISKKFNNKSLYFIPLAILYGFCAYFTAYYWNIMWLDGLVFLPLIILGIEKIVNENKYLQYILSLATMLIANYFVAYMICIFSVLYFISYLIIKTDKFNLKELFKKCSVFGLSSITAGGITAFLLLPLFLGMSSISATSDFWPTSQYYSFNIIEFLANHFTGVGSTVLSSGISNAPNISVGVIGVALLFLFVFNNKISKKVKITYLCLLFVLIGSFLYAPLDFIWHAFHVPNDLPYRYSFLYSFVLIIIAAYSLYNIKHLSFKIVSSCYVIIMILISLLYFFKYDNITNSMIILNYLMASLYFIIYCLYKYYPSLKQSLPLAFILAVILECTISINNNWDMTQIIENFYSDYNSMQNALKYIDIDNDSAMYRVDRTNILSYNDPSWYGYYGQTTFSSMAYENMAILQNQLGIPGNEINSYYYKQNTPIYDLMFNIKYFFGDTWDITRYSLVYNTEGHLVFKSKFNPGLMFAVNSDIKNWSYNGYNPFSIQNEFMKLSTEIDATLEKLHIIDKDTIYENENNKKVIKYTFANPLDNMYFYAKDSDIDYIIVNETLYYLNDDFNYSEKLGIDIFDFRSINENYVINTRSDEETYSIYVGYNNYRFDAFSAYFINNDNFEDAAKILVENSVNIESFKESNIKASINLEADKTIYTSIPFDKGWKVYVNEKQIDTMAFADTLLMFDLEAGENIIELKYFPHGMISGIYMSILFTAGLFIVYYIMKKRELKKQ